jgi:uncharacterized membrane protein YqjE
MRPDTDELDHEADRERGAFGQLLHAISGLIATLLATLQTRLELLGIDIQNGARLALSSLLWSLVALLTFVISLIFAGLTLIIVFWDTHRVLAAVLVTTGFLGVSALAALSVMSRLHNAPRPFDATLSELERDQQPLKNRE